MWILLTQQARRKKAFNKKTLNSEPVLPRQVWLRLPPLHPCASLKGGGDCGLGNWRLENLGAGIRGFRVWGFGDLVGLGLWDLGI